VKLETKVGLFVISAIGVFLYLSINIRALRLDKDRYNEYKAYFEDTNGLAIKAPVKIAGVDVGWVEKISLLEDGKADVLMLIDKHIRLSKNAHAVINQDGLIGVKTLEIDPGDPSTGALAAGSTLAMPGKSPTSVGQLLERFNEIASTVQDITTSFKSVFATHKGEEQMRGALDAVTRASTKIADFSEVLQRTMVNNEANLNNILSTMNDTISDFKTKNTIGKASDAFENVSDAAIQGRETLKEAGEIVEKINSGKGLVGKLINEDETYTDIKKTVRGIKDYLNKTQSLMLSIDMHSETMLSNNNSKGYAELRLRPTSDYFYQIQMVVDREGSVYRKHKRRQLSDRLGNDLNPSTAGLSVRDQIRFAETEDTITQRKNDVLFGLQFGKRFNRLAFRVGLFENSFGAAVDWYVPLQTDKVHWITSLEAFDFDGQKRFDSDGRPHVKWMNKAFFMKSFYTCFGFDDIYSKRSASAFFGGGLRFNDDDLKYFLGSLGSAKSGAR
jgi:phospholipid/cholesterol/gamma-HCH transport system substrate-binding protein